MNNAPKLIVSHAPFWHNGSGVPERNYNFVLALLPAIAMGLSTFGAPALGVISLSVASAVGWEIVFNKISKRPITVEDWHAALNGLLFGLMLPATAPFWLVLTGTFFTIFIGKQIFGGIGSPPFQPAVLATAILAISWPLYFDFDARLLHYDFDFNPAYPPVALKAFGPGALEQISLMDLFLGRQVGGIGATCGAALVLGGLYLIARGIVRWEIPLAYLAGIVLTATLFYLTDPARYATPMTHLLIGNVLFGAFFLATDYSSCPVNVIPMLIYGVAGGAMTILIRNIGAYPEGTIYAILVINLINPLIDKIRPKAIGKGA